MQMVGCLMITERVSFLSSPLAVISLHLFIYAFVYASIHLFYACTVISSIAILSVVVITSRLRWKRRPHALENEPRGVPTNVRVVGVARFSLHASRTSIDSLAFARVNDVQGVSYELWEELGRARGDADAAEVTVVEEKTKRRVAATSLGVQIRAETFAPDVVVAARHVQWEGVEHGVGGGVDTGAKIDARGVRLGDEGVWDAQPCADGAKRRLARRKGFVVKFGLRTARDATETGENGAYGDVVASNARAHG